MPKGGFIISTNLNSNFFIIFYFFILIFLIIYSSISHISSKNSNNINSNFISQEYYFSNSNFTWPIPGYHNISSPFGKRTSPTNGASSNHSGIDISAPTGTSIYAIISGKVIFTGFLGANGHSIIIQNDNIKILYCHISSNYFVKINDYIKQGDLISYVGPKYINDIANNPYKDSTGKSTNGALTGPHLHLTIKIDDVPVNPLLYF